MMSALHIYVFPHPWIQQTVDQEHMKKNSLYWICTGFFPLSLFSKHYSITSIYITVTVLGIMCNLQYFYIRDLSICGFWYRGPEGNPPRIPRDNYFQRRPTHHLAKIPELPWSLKHWSHMKTVQVVGHLPSMCKCPGFHPQPWGEERRKKKNRKQPKCPSIMGEWIAYAYTHVLEYFSALKERKSYQL
jgi:hypothetical protein